MPLVCTIEMSKTTGITVTVQNGDECTQTICMDGSQIVLTVKGQDATSTITQKADSVTIACQTFTVNADKVECHANKETLTLTSKDTMTFTSSAQLSAQAIEAMTLKGQSISETADQSIELKGNTGTFTGTSSVTVTGSSATLKGDTSVTVNGGTSVNVSSNGMMTLESSGIATLKGSITNVQGNLVKLG